MTPPRAVAALALLLSIAAMSASASLLDERIIVIRPDRLQPSTIRVIADARVVFVNQSGTDVHVEFVGRSGHSVFPVDGRFVAVFHGPGSHAYVVHVGDRTRGLRGSVEVAPGSSAPVPARTCASVTVMEVCLEP